MPVYCLSTPCSKPVSHVQHLQVVLSIEDCKKFHCQGVLLLARLFCPTRHETPLIDVAVQVVAVKLHWATAFQDSFSPNRSSILIGNRENSKFLHVQGSPSRIKSSLFKVRKVANHCPFEDRNRSIFLNFITTLFSLVDT